MKYEFTGETKVESGVTLRRIRAVTAFGATAAGAVGGWVEKEANLDRFSGDAWVSGNARVSGGARVYGNAWVSGDAWVYGNARVSGDARVYGDALVSGYARVYGGAWVSGGARVYGNAQVSGDARVSGDALVSGDADLLLVGPIGSRRSYLTVTADAEIGVRYSTGCFSGNLKTLKAAVKRDHGKTSLYAKQYAAAIAMAKVCVKAKK